MRPIFLPSQRALDSRIDCDTIDCMRVTKYVIQKRNADDSMTYLKHLEFSMTWVTTESLEEAQKFTSFSDANKLLHMQAKQKDRWVVGGVTVRM